MSSETEPLGRPGTVEDTLSPWKNERSDSRPPFGSGDIVGHYEVRGILGAGGMGVVYNAYHPDLERTVALKVIRPDGRTPSGRARTRLLREAQALARLQHPNVVTVYDVGTEEDQLFIAMELVAGVPLGEWLNAAPRAWREVRDVFLAAGRGLAAAHAAGIVHRDFKPSNVIVGADRVVVVDFGLALARTAEGSGDGRPRPANTLLELDLTLTGERMGTPRYMAPEQHGGAPVTEVADQFAFATALWSALYGTVPFDGSTVEELRAKIARGPRTPFGRHVPGHVEAALRRALALAPADRWPALADLLRELARDPLARRRRLALGGALACAVLAVAAASFGLGRKAAEPAMCSGGAALVEPVWNDGVRESIRAAFRGTGRPYADETFALVNGTLERWQRDWARAHRDACEATEVRQEQSAELLDARMACLGRARTEMTALVSLLSDPDAVALDRAASAVSGLGDVTVCANVSALREVAAPPADPSARRQIEQLRADLAHIEAHGRLGQLSDGLAAGKEIVERARAVGYAPVLAEALDTTVWFEIQTGRDEEAIALAYEAARVAADARDDARVASGLTRLTFALGADLRRFREAEVAWEAARTAAARAGNPGTLLERLYSDREQVLYYEGDRLAVMPLCQIVFALGVALHGPDSYQAALALSELADATKKLGFHREADRMFGRALSTAETVLGREHPFVLAVLNNAGAARLDDFDFDGAAPLFERALAAKERIFGPDDARVALSAHNLAIARREQRRLAEARALSERAIRIREARLGPTHPFLATSYDELARLDLLEGRRAEALAGVERAIAILRGEGQLDPSLADAYTVQAEVLVALGRIDEARAAVERAAEAAKQIGDDPVQRANVLATEADVLRAGRQPAKAVLSYRRAIELLEGPYGKSGRGLLEPLLGLGGAELEAGDSAAALAVAERAVEIARGAPSDRVAAAENLLARARRVDGRLAGK